jgi:hypothetical protein
MSSKLTPPNAGEIALIVRTIVRIGCLKTDWKGVDAGELLKQHGLAFHYRQRGSWANVPKSKYRCAVGNYRNPKLDCSWRLEWLGVWPWHLHFVFFRQSLEKPGGGDQTSCHT